VYTALEILGFGSAAAVFARLFSQEAA